jgi:hypothetical protein
MLASPAFAVEREIVGNDREGALICGDGLFSKYCCCAVTADRRAACADCCSLVFGDEEKNWVNLFPLDVEGLRDVGLSEEGRETTVLGELANGFRGSL